MSLQMEKRKPAPIKTDGKPAEKSTTSPAISVDSVDSGVGLDAPVTPGRVMTTADLAYTPTEEHGAAVETPESPISTLVNGHVINAGVIEDMARDLAEARARGEFPPATAPGFDIQATVNDHARLLRVRDTRGIAVEAPVNTTTEGRVVDIATIESMARELAEARARGEFPASTATGFSLQATFEDHTRLLRLREALSAAAVQTPVATMINGRAFDAATIEAMAGELAEARANGDFPRTIAPVYDVQATFDDHARLVRLGEARGTAPREQWTKMREVNILYVEIARQIKERDAKYKDKVRDQTHQGRVNNMVRGCHGEVNLYRLVQHAVHHAVSDHAVRHDIASGGISMSRISQVIRDVIKEHGEATRTGLAETELETVLEEVFGMIEHALVDAAGPLRINVNRLDGTATRLDNITGAQEFLNEDHRAITRDQESHVRNMDMINRAHQGHVDAIGTHVRAIGTQVGALGTGINVMHGALNSANGNVETMASQLDDLQTIVGMLPDVVTRIVENTVREILSQLLPQALQEAVAPAVVQDVSSRIQARVGAMQGAATNKTTSEKVSSSATEGGKSSKKPGFFKRFFGRGPKGPDSGPSAGGACL